MVKTRFNPPKFPADLRRDTLDNQALNSYLRQVSEWAREVDRHDHDVLPACQVRQTADQSIPHNTIEELDFDSTEFDPLGWHSDTINNARIRPTIPGWYRATIQIDFANGNDYTRLQARLNRDGVSFTNPPLFLEVPGFAATTVSGTLGYVSPLVFLNGTTQYLSAHAFQLNGATAARDSRSMFLVELVTPT